MTIVCRVMILVCLCLAVSVDVMAEAEQEKPSRWKGWESHLKIGSQTYLNELNPDPGSAPLAGFLIGRQLSGRSFVGVSFASAGYEITYLSGTTDEKQVGSFLIVYQFRFRQGHRFRPYLDAGLGVADNRLRHGCEGCLHVRLGGCYALNEKWALSLESRGVSWSQDDTPDVAEILGAEGSSVTVSSNEFALGVVYLW